MQTELRRCLEEFDIAGARAFWRQHSPHLPQPENDEQAAVTLHMARTAARSMQARLRFYSHRWLTERGYPSQLPDHLRPMAERMFPQVVEAVGISVNFSPAFMKPAEGIVRGAMENVVNEMYADGDTAPDLVRTRMMEAKRAEQRKLFGG